MQSCDPVLNKEIYSHITKTRHKYQALHCKAFFLHYYGNPGCFTLIFGNKVRNNYISINIGSN